MVVKIDERSLLAKPFPFTATIDEVWLCVRCMHRHSGVEA